MSSPARRTTTSQHRPGPPVFQVGLNKKIGYGIKMELISAKYCPSPSDHETEEIKCTTVIAPYNLTFCVPTIFAGSHQDRVLGRDKVSAASCAIVPDLVQVEVQRQAV